MDLVIVVLMLSPTGNLYRLAEMPVPGMALATCQSAQARWDAMETARELTGYTPMAATCVVRGKA